MIGTRIERIEQMKTDFIIVHDYKIRFHPFNLFNPCSYPQL